MIKNRWKFGPPKRATATDLPTSRQRPADSAARFMLAIESFADRYSRFVVARRVWLIVASLVVVPFLGLSLLHAELSADASVFFGEDNPELIALEELDDTYAGGNSVLFVVSNKSGSLFTSDSLKALAQMTDEAWQGPYLLRADSIANFQEMRSQGDDITTAPLYSADETFTPQRLAEIERKTLSQDELVNTLISPDGHVAGIAVAVVLPNNDASAMPTVTEFARELAKQWEARWPFLEVRITGGILADMTFAEAADRDLRTLVPMMGLIIIAALVIGLRSIRATVVVMAVVVSAAIAGLGSALWLGSEINAATAVSPVAIMVLTLASAIHLLIAWIRAGSEGHTSKEAVCESVKVNFAPIALTSVTTMLGFLSLNFSDAPPLRELGNIVTVGTGFCWVLCLTLLPALISYVRPPPPMMLDRWAGSLRWIGMVTTEHPLKIVMAFAVITPVMAYGASWIVLDDNYIRYFDDRFEFRQDTDYTEEHLSGLNGIEYSLDSGTTGGVFDPEFLAKVDEFANWFSEQPNVDSVYALPSMIKRLNRAVLGGGEAGYRIADTREANAQSFLLYELSLPGDLSTGFIDINRAQTLVSVSVSGGSSLEIRRLASEGDDWLRANAPDIGGQGSGLSVAFAYVSERNLNAMVTGTIFALVLVSIILVVAFQSVRTGLVTLVPNLLPALLAFGIWGYLVGEINLAATVVTSMTFGIVVDDTIHITMKYLRGRRVLGESPQTAVRSAISIVGFPVILTTIAIGSGFAVTALSGFQLSVYLGGLTVLIVCIALIADLFLTPSLLLLTERVRR